MEYFISNFLEVKNTSRGLGVFTKIYIPKDQVIEHSPFSSLWKSTWPDTPYDLKKIVFSFPQGSKEYVIALGYVSIYNHRDDNNAKWNTSENGLYIKTLKNIYPNEEIFIHYGDAYWAGGWTKY